MSETIIILNYRLTRELWQQFLDAHFSNNRALKMRYLWGVVCIMIGALGFGGFYDSPVIASLLLATGLFSVLSKHLAGRQIPAYSLPSPLFRRRADRGDFAGRGLGAQRDVRLPPALE
jgi:hypothetical protein